MEIEEDLPPEGEEAGAIDAPEADDLETETQGATDEPEAPSLEDIASDMGWSPQEKWRGDPDKWKPAHEFVRNTADINSKLGNRLDTMQRQMETMARTSAQITEQALAKQRQELLDQRNEAFETGDADAFNKADKALNELQKSPQATVVAPEVADFVERNSNWFEKDQEATAWAQNRCGELARQGFGAARQIQIVEREAKQYFPEHFEEAKPKPKPAPLNGPGKRAAPRVAAKTFANLPDDAKKAALDFEKNGRCTKEEYATIYFEEQEA